MKRRKNAPRKREINVYYFDELPKDLKKKVLEKYYDINVDGDFWYEPILEEFALAAAKVNWIIMPKDIEFDIYRYEFSVNSRNIGHKKYNVELSQRSYGARDKEITADDISYIDTENQHEIATVVTDLVRLTELMRRCLSALKASYDDATSEEQIADTLRANEYEFDDSGKIV